MPELPGLVHIIDMVYIVNSEPLSVFYNPGKSMEFTDICLQRVYIRQCDRCVVELLKERMGGGGGCLVNKMCWDTVNFYNSVVLNYIFFWGILSFTG